MAGPTYTGKRRVLIPGECGLSEGRCLFQGEHSAIPPLTSTNGYLNLCPVRWQKSQNPAPLLQYPHSKHLVAIHAWLVAATLGRTVSQCLYQYRELCWPTLLWVSSGACCLFLEEPPLSAGKDWGLRIKTSHLMFILREKWGQ